MGAGASIEMDGEAKAMAEEMVFHIFQASLDDLVAAVKAAPDADVPESLKASVALWKTEYAVIGQVQVKDVQKTTELVLADAAIQVVEESGAPRMLIQGQPSAPTGGQQPAASDEASRLFWCAHFDTKDAYHVDHKQRPSNQAFAMQFLAQFKHYPELAEGETPTKEQLMMAGKQSMAGSYMGFVWHLEKPGADVNGTTYTTITRAKCKDAAAAGDMIALTKATALRSLALEEGALRCTIVPPHLTGIPGVGGNDMPSDVADDVTVTVVHTFKDQDAYAAHKATPHFSEGVAKGAGIVADPAADVTVLEFAETAHFAKPAAAASTQATAETAEGTGSAEVAPVQDDPAPSEALPAEATLVSEDGTKRVTLSNGVAVIATRQGENTEFEDWRCCSQCTLRDSGELGLVYTSKKKGGKVEYTIVPNFEQNTFTGDLDYEE